MVGLLTFLALSFASCFTSHAFIISPTQIALRKSRTANALQRLQSSASPTISQDGKISISEGSFSAALLADYWGREPLLMRKAFPLDSNQENNEESWPSWDLMMNEIASEEDAEARIIRHIPGDVTSYTLDVGPFEDLSFLEHEDEKWTLVVNDVDRFHPPLSDWVDQNFAFIPRWRRDDAQVSLAPLGGGIGPHVDNYDVFLIQTSGRREWQVGLDKISAQDELDSSVPDISVRILENWEERRESSPGGIVSLILEPGDVLYLPPRIPHCGTAVSEQCMTLSVGCRAPSATELVAKLAEGLSDSLAKGAVQRYQDLDLLSRQSSGSASLVDAKLTEATKDDMKQLVLNAVQEVLNDDSQWDALVGRITTEPKRPREDYPMSLEETDPEWLEELGIWGNPEKAVEAVCNGEGTFFRAEGISATFSKVENSSYRLFMNGIMFEIAVVDQDREALCALLTAIVNAPELNQDTLSPLVHHPAVLDLLKALVKRGFLYGSSAEDE